MAFADVPFSQDFLLSVQQFFSQTFQLPAGLLAWPVVLYAVIIPVIGAFAGFLWLLHDFGFFQRSTHATGINIIIAAFFLLLSFRFIVTMSVVAYALLAAAFIIWIMRKIASW